jgi:branched-chain amino acid aminotransferase
MKECINSKFFLDGEFVDCLYFQPDFINKGISIYEVLRLIRNRLLFVNDHLQRLELSVQLADLDGWYTIDEIARIIFRLPVLNKISDGNVKIVYNYLNDKKRHVLVYFVSSKHPSKLDYQKGVKVLTYPFTRENPNKKIWLPDFRAATDKLIHQKKIWEVLIVNKSNHVTEASRANFFAIKKGTVITPPVESVLAGITRKYVIDICMEQRIPIAEKEIPKNTLSEYDTVFLTSTSSNVLPVAQIDQLTFRVDDPVVRLIMKEFDDLVEREVTGH